MTVCVCEKTSQHAASPALVEGRERIGRGVYFSMHYNKAKTRITNQFLKRRDLASGDLSVWRLGEPYGAQVEDVAAILEESGPGGSELSHIYYAGAENIRFVEAASVNADQSLCIKDDCTSGPDGECHPAHATIGLADVDGVDWDPDGTAFREVYESLALLFRKSVAWTKIGPDQPLPRLPK
tara:strand:- start:159 stop:704 length:546 start_codon:yes stop_codon:yes gene_type:complete